jgi:hypothetical protein
MSALGHKRTFWPFTVMSALPPKADIRCGTLAMAAKAQEQRASSAYNDLRPPVWPGSARGPFSPLWLPRPCSQKTRASVLLAPTYRHNKFPTARAFGESLAASRQTNSPLGQILHSCRLSTTAGAEPRCTNLLTAKAPTERRGQVSFPEFRKVQPFYRPR